MTPKEPKQDEDASASVESESNNIEWQRATTLAGKKKTTLSLSRYSPDLRQKRVQKRIIDALEYFMQYYLSERELQLSTKILESHFGSHAKPMFNWLRSRLLRQVRSYSTYASRAITYVVNQEGFDKTWLRIGRTFDYARERARQVEPSFRPFIDGQEDLPLHRTVEGGRCLWAASDP